MTVQEPNDRIGTDPATMKKFKYQMLRVYGVDPSKHERALNETGEDGWELVSALERRDDVGDAYVIYYLKKELPNAA